MPEAKNIPKIRKLQGKVQLPYNVREKTRTDEDGNQEIYYAFDRLNLNQAQLPSLEQAKKQVVTALQADLHKHIYPEYDQGSQASIQAIAQKAERNGLSDIADECEKIFNWIEDCLDYYYARKDDILNATDEQSLVTINWNFVGNVPKPSDLKTLREIKGMFS